MGKNEAPAGAIESDTAVMVEQSNSEKAVMSALQADAYEPSPPMSGLLIWGWIFLLVGVIVVFIAFNLETSVESPSSGSALIGSYVPASNVINIGLLQRQMMVFLIGLAVGLGGLISLFIASATKVICDNFSSEKAA